MVDGKKRHRISLVDCQPFQRFEENFGRVQRSRFVRAMRSGDELRLGTTRHVRLKNCVRVVEIRNDQGEPGKIFLQRFIQNPALREEACQRAGFKGSNLIYQTARERQLHDVWIAEHFQPRLRELLPARFEWERCRLRPYFAPVAIESVQVISTVAKTASAVLGRTTCS